MNFTINKEAFVDILSKVQGLTGRKSSLAITANVLLKAQQNHLTITATDLETAFEGRYPAQIETDGMVALNARKLFEIVRDFPSNSILLHELENSWIEIGNKTVEYHIVGMNPEDFPQIPKMEEVDYTEIDSAKLKQMIECTGYIAGQSDETRAHIVGTYFVSLAAENASENRQIRMVSTDGHRLSMVNAAIPEDMDFSDGDSVLVPKKGLAEINKFLEGDGVVRIGIKENHLVIKKENETFIIRLLEGDFPKYEEILSLEDGHLLIMDKQQFMMTLKRMSILSSEEYKGVIFKFENGSLRINSTNPEIGESKENMAINFSGNPIEVSFNPRFFIETLNHIDEDRVILNIINDRKPCRLQAAEDKTFLSVIMPMRF